MERSLVCRAGCLALHDPLAAVSLVDPSVCTYKYGQVAVDLSTGRAGFTEFVAANPEGATASDRPLVEVAASVNVESFFRPILCSVCAPRY